MKVDFIMHLITLALFALFLSGCVTTDIVKPLSKKDQGRRNIETVSVTYGELSRLDLEKADEELSLKKLSAEKPDAIEFKPLKVALKEIAKKHLEKRDTDEEFLADVAIEVANLKLSNPGMIMLVGDSDQLAGMVRIYDTKSRELLSEIYVDIIKSKGGLIGLAMRGVEDREYLSEEFASVIGDKLGFKSLPSKTTE